MRFISPNPFYISPPSSTSSSPVNNLESDSFDQDQINEDFYQKNKQIVEDKLDAVFEHRVFRQISLVLAIDKETYAVAWLALKSSKEHELAIQRCYFFHITFNFPSEKHSNTLLLTDFSSKDIDFYQIETPPEEITQAVTYLLNKLNQIDG